jgi:hypothetical protein
LRLPKFFERFSTVIMFEVDVSILFDDILFSPNSFFKRVCYVLVILESLDWSSLIFSR